jgi:hypothetical protein
MFSKSDTFKITGSLTAEKLLNPSVYSTLQPRIEGTLAHPVSGFKNGI